MSTMMEAAPHPDPGQSAGMSPAASAAQSYCLSRAGGRPLRFDGSELAMAMSFSPEVPYWYEINLYRTVQQTFVVAVRLFYQSESKTDTLRAWESETIDDAIDKMAQYDAAFDIPVTADVDVNTAPPAEIAAHAMLLKAQISDARHHYESLVGEMLYDLENGA